MRNTSERDEAVAARQAAVAEAFDQSTGEIQGGPATLPDVPPPLDEDDSPF